MPKSFKKRMNEGVEEIITVVYKVGGKTALSFSEKLVRSKVFWCRILFSGTRCCRGIKNLKKHTNLIFYHLQSIVTPHVKSA